MDVVFFFGVCGDVYLAEELFAGAFLAAVFEFADGTGGEEG